MNNAAGKAIKAIKNMSFTLKSMAALKTSQSIFFETGGDAELPGFTLATGTDSASENWAFFPQDVSCSEEKIAHVCAFFKDLGLPFIWPLFPDAAYGEILENVGMPMRGELLVMARTGYANIPPASAKNLTFETSKTSPKNDIAKVWAETAWMAFNSPPGTPDSFVNMARGLSDDDIILLLAKRDGIPVGTVMLTISGGSAGIYYFATIPEERRAGVGKALLHEASRLAFEHHRTLLTLQATPEGVPFYSSQGFKPLFRLPIHSFSEDVF